MEECIDLIIDENIRTKLDENFKYFQAKFEESDRNETTFTSHDGIYRITWMKFGLKKGPGIFQRAIEVILSTSKWQYALIYLSYEMLFLKSMEKLMTYFDRSLKFLKKKS